VGHEAAAPLLAAVELTQLFRRQLVQLGRALDAKLGGADFDRLVSRVDMAERLRLDLWAFAEICRQADVALRGNDSRAAARGLARIREYATYFQDVSYQLLRYGDYEAFDRFTAIVVETDEPPHGPGARARLAEDCRVFAEVAATMSAAVGRRSELSHRRLDRERAMNLVGRFAAP
jgi:hypothetical protein